MDTKVEIDIGYKGFGEHVLSIRRYFYKDGKISLTMICRHKLYDRLYESVGKINHLIEKGSFEKIWLDENDCIEVFKYKGESQIHIRHTDEGVMLNKTHWENLVWLMQKYAKTIGFDRYFGV